MVGWDMTADSARELPWSLTRCGHAWTPLCGTLRLQARPSLPAANGVSASAIKLMNVTGLLPQRPKLSPALRPRPPPPYGNPASKQRRYAMHGIIAQTPPAPTLAASIYTYASSAQETLSRPTGRLTTKAFTAAVAAALGSIAPNSPSHLTPLERTYPHQDLLSATAHTNYTVTAVLISSSIQKTLPYA